MRHIGNVVILAFRGRKNKNYKIIGKKKETKPTVPFPSTLAHWMAGCIWGSENVTLGLAMDRMELCRLLVSNMQNCLIDAMPVR